MAIESKSRFRWNFTVLFAVAIFCIAGFAVSRTAFSSSGSGTSASGVGATPRAKQTVPRTFVKDGNTSKQVSPAAVRGELVFGIGGFASNLFAVTNVGTTNDLTNLTYSIERNPVFSPDGNKILFTSYRDGEFGSGYQEIYSMNPNGSDQTRLTTSNCNLANYTFSPDSSKIAFICNGNLSTMNADGSGAVLIADYQNQITEPQYSPDGTKIIFIYDGSIWRIDTDGQNGAELGNLGGKERARFSPDGTKIVFSANSDIYAMNADGTNEVTLIDNAYYLDQPDFSPDGTKLLMSCQSGGHNYCTSDADGGNFAPLGGSIFERSYAAWSPDSSTIAFIARNNATNTYGIYTATIGGEPQLVYLENPGTPMNYLAWQPECPGSPTPTPTPAGTPIPGLISEWNANNLNADDSQGINHGQFIDNSALTVIGKRGYGFYFSGDGGYINVPDSSSLDVQTGDYTLSTWFYPAATAEHYVAGKGACDGGGSNFYIGVDTNFNPFIDISHSSGGSRTGSSGYTLSQNVWHNLLLKKEGTSFTLYVDNVLAISHTESGTMDTSDQPFTLGKGIGCSPPQLTTNGGVDEVLLFGRALNTQEIGAIYNGYVPPIGATPTPTPTNSGLVGFWRANDSAADSSGTNHGILEGNTHYSTGHQGNAFDFDGGGDRVRVLDNGNDILDVQTGDFTVAAWVYIRSNGTHFIAGKELDNGSYSLKVQGQALYFYLLKDGNYQYINTGDDVTLNTWHHVAGVRSNGMIRVFVDGGERSSTTFTDSLVPNSNDFTIGGPIYSTSPQPDTDGLIDDVRLYNRGLDGTEMMSIYSDPGFAAIHNVPRRNEQGLTDLVCQAPADPAVELRVNYPHPIAAGRQTSVNVRLKDYAPAGGTTVSLAYSDAGIATGPPSVTVPEGSNELNFDITTTVSSVFRSSDVTATLNTETARVTVTVWPAAPEVVVSNLAAPTDVDIIADFSASWTVTNNGQAPTNSYRQDTFFLSTDDLLFNDPNDRVVGRSYDNNGVLAPGQSKSMTFGNVNIPATYVPTDGTYYLFVLIGDAGTVQERNGNFADNFMSVPITVHRNLPDLVALNVQGPTEIEPNVTFSVSWDVKNQGSRAVTAGSNHYVYFSYDNIVGNADDVGITFRRLGAIGINETQSFSQQFSLPTVPAKPSSDGLFYVKVDHANEIYEDAPGGPAEINNVTTAPVRFEYRVPDLQVTSVTPPTEVESDTEFALNWTTQNTGTKATIAMTERVYFSTDNVVSGNDALIGSFDLSQALAPGESVNRSQIVTIPTNSIATTGNYYVYVVTDLFNAIDEGANESNNTTFSPLRVRRLLRPDLQVTNITAPATAFFGQEIQIQWTVANNGNGPTNAANWQDDLYLGLNQSLNGATRLVTASNISFLNAGESYIATATVRIPRGLNGSYGIIVKTDKDGTVNEESEINNVTSKPITLNVPLLPDLGVSNVQAPAEGFSGQPIAVSWTVTNSGGLATPLNEATWRDAIYLSTDAAFSGDDRYIGFRERTGALAVNGSYTVANFSVDLPNDVFGNYYVFVKADHYDQVYEFTSENNNTDHDRIGDGSPMNVIGTPPDLVILNQQITAPATALAGNTITVSYVEKNQGAFDAVGNWRDELFLSTDQTIDESDILLGSQVRNGNPAGQQFVASFDVTIPTCLQGTYYLLGRTDSNNTIFEFNPGGDAESNNLANPKAIELSSFAPDLRVTAITIPPVVLNGAMPISWTVQNFGTAATTQSNWNDRIFLLTGNQVITLGSFAHQGSLAINGQYSQNQIVYIPLYLEGSFQIFVRTDDSNFVPECAFDMNNDDYRVADIQQDLPDMRSGALNGPGTATLGSSVNVSWNGGNFGAAMPQSTTWVDTIYLSSDPIYSGGDTPVGSKVTSATLINGQSYGANTSITVPNVLPGNYYLVVNADSANNVEEGVNEGNNGSTGIPITLTVPDVDLTVSALSANPILYSGQLANVSWTITNNGANPTVTNSWADYVILSRDSVVDASDRVLDYRVHNGVLGGGASYSETSSLAIPGGLTGEYKIFVIADIRNYVVESNDSNNASAPFTVDLQLPPPAEMNITNISSPTTVSLGESSVIEWTVQNSSNNVASGVWQDSVYLSADQFWDSSDTFVGQRPRSGTVAAFATYTETLDTTIPPVEPGNYYVIVRTDARNNIRESNETNNVATSVGQTAVVVPNLTIGTPLLTTLMSGQERYYSIFNTPADETMLVTLTGQSGSQNELYSKAGSMVSRANYQYQGRRQGAANQENLIDNTAPGSYFTMVRADYVPASFAGNLNKTDRTRSTAAAAENITIKAELLQFGVRSISPTTAGNAGYSMVVAEGAKFKPNSSIKLVRGGIELMPIKTIVTSNTQISGLFDLNEKTPGSYQVIVTDPIGGTSTAPEPLNIVPGGGYRVTQSIIGATTTRVRTWNSYTVSFLNEGLNDSISTPLLIMLPEGTEYNLSTANFIGSQQSDLPDGYTPESLPLHFDIDGRRVISLIAPIIRSGQKIEIRVDLKWTTGNMIEATALPSLYIPEAYTTSGLGGLGDNAQNLSSLTAKQQCLWNFLRQALMIALGRIIPARCAAAVIEAILSTVNDTLVASALSSFNGFDAFVGFTLKYIKTTVACATDLAGKLTPLAIAEFAWDVYQSMGVLVACEGGPKEDGIFFAPYRLYVYFVGSIDPNEKIGPQGYGADKFVPVNQPLTYRINFENLATASAPAQRIRIVDQLPATLDPQTVRLIEIGFKQYRVEVPPNRAFYQSRIQLGADLNGLKVDISAGLNIVNGTITWNLTAVDPNTNEQPLDPNAGILPPNNANHDGEGYAIFTVQPKIGQPTRTDLANLATIIFDDNEPIITNTTTNLLDSTLPTSSIAPIPATTSVVNVPLNWSGSDDPTDSGLKSYDVFVSENGRAYKPLLTDTIQTSTIFEGNFGRTYTFYSIAHDNAGNSEAAPVVADAGTQIDGGAFEGDVASRPNGDNDGTVNTQDAAQVRRFAAKLDADYLYNEFQRADVSPLVDGGDGSVSVADVMQVSRYAAGTDAVRGNAGPMAAVPLAGKAKIGKTAGLLPRSLYPMTINRTSNKIIIGVGLEAQGDETGAGFTLNYNTAHLANPANITLGPDAAGGAITFNTSQTGKVGIIVDKLPNQPIAAGGRLIATIEFDVIDLLAASTQFTFGSDPVASEVVDGTASALTTDFPATTVPMVGPTAAGVSVSGTVKTATGRPIPYTVIYLADEFGARQRAITNPFGYYRFDDVEAGRTYVIGAKHRTVQFVRPSFVISVADSVEDADFVGLE